MKAEHRGTGIADDITAADALEGRGRTLLMFAYYFPPCNCWPTASERSLGFAKGLLDSAGDPSSSRARWRQAVSLRSGPETKRSVPRVP